MLVYIRKNKKYIFKVLTFVLFGIMGLLIVPVVRFIIYVATHYPKLFRLIFFALIFFMYVYGFLFIQEWNKRFVIIYICITIIINAINTNRRK